eukprot:g7818.t1
MQSGRNIRKGYCERCGEEVKWKGEKNGVGHFPELCDPCIAIEHPDAKPLILDTNVKSDGKSKPAKGAKLAVLVEWGNKCEIVNAVPPARGDKTDEEWREEYQAWLDLDFPGFKVEFKPGRNNRKRDMIQCSAKHKQLLQENGCSPSLQGPVPGGSAQFKKIVETINEIIKAEKEDKEAESLPSPAEPSEQPLPPPRKEHKEFLLKQLNDVAKVIEDLYNFLNGASLPVGWESPELKEQVRATRLRLLEGKSSAQLGIHDDNTTNGQTDNSSYQKIRAAIIGAVKSGKSFLANLLMHLEMPRPTDYAQPNQGLSEQQKLLSLEGLREVCDENDLRSLKKSNSSDMKTNDWTTIFKKFGGKVHFPKQDFKKKKRGQSALEYEKCYRQVWDYAKNNKSGVKPLWVPAEDNSDSTTLFTQWIAYGKIAHLLIVFRTREWALLHIKDWHDYLRWLLQNQRGDYTKVASYEMDPPERPDWPDRSQKDLKTLQVIYKLLTKEGWKVLNPEQLKLAPEKVELHPLVAKQLGRWLIYAGEGEDLMLDRVYLRDMQNTFHSKKAQWSSSTIWALSPVRFPSVPPVFSLNVTIRRARLALGLGGSSSGGSVSTSRAVGRHL